MTAPLTPTTGTLYEGELLYFVDGATTYVVQVQAPTTTPYTYTVGTPLVVNIKRAAVAVPATAVAQSYLGIHLCVKKADLTPSPTTLDNSTTCTGKISTSVTVATEYKLDLSFLSNNDASYWSIRKLSQGLKSAYFALSYDAQALEIGVVQFNALAETGAEAKNQVMATISGNVQAFSDRFVGTKGSTVAELALQDVERKLWGMSLTGEEVV